MNSWLDLPAVGLSNNQSMNDGAYIANLFHNFELNQCPDISEHIVNIVFLDTVILIIIYCGLVRPVLYTEPKNYIHSSDCIRLTFHLVFLQHYWHRLQI